MSSWIDVCCLECLETPFADVAAIDMWTEISPKNLVIKQNAC